MRTDTGPTFARFVRVTLKCAMAISVAVTMTAAVASDADAKRKRSKGNPKYAGYVIDARTGKVLYAENAHAKRYPASLTKMMTLYLMFEDMKAGRVKKSTRIRFSRNAAKEPPSKLGIRAGRSITAEQAIYALVTKSANDVATAVGEHLSGSESAFAKRMTLKARQLGMRSTVFRNAHGLPNKHQVTTAADMAKLGLALREHFPGRYKYFKTRSYRFGRRRLPNHNRLLGRVRGVDGIKTGYIRASGFNLVTSVSTRGKKIVAVVMGGRSGRSRNAHMKRLISRYLPKASRRGSKQLVASARSSHRSDAAVRTVRVASLASVAKPTFKPRAAKTYATRISAVEIAKKIKIRPPKALLIEDQIAALAAPPEPRADNKTDATADPATTASAQEPPSGWQIQIGATDNRELAEALLAKARKKTPTVLASAEKYTEPVVRNGETLYRARFVGFSSKRSANRACKVLKRKRFACLALNN